MTLLAGSSETKTHRRMTVGFKKTSQDHNRRRYLCCCGRGWSLTETLAIPTVVSADNIVYIGPWHCYWACNILVMNVLHGLQLGIIDWTMTML